MPTTMYSSNALEKLADMLALRIREDSARGGFDPFRPLDVVVQTPGVARWLSLSLADRLGACMNVRYLFPRNYIEQCCEELVGEPEEGGAPAKKRATSLFGADEERMVWALFSLLGEVADEPGFDTLGRYLEDGNTRKRLQLARRLATLYDQYMVYRPEMVARWSAGGTVSEDDDEAWQAALWRKLEQKGVTGIHLAGILPSLQRSLFAQRGNENEEPGRGFVDTLASEEDDDDDDWGGKEMFSGPRASHELSNGDGGCGMPVRRVYLFALSTLPPLHVEFFKVLSEAYDVALFSLVPCGQYWGDLPGRKEAAKAQAIGSDYGFGQPLLSSFGKQGRDFLNVLSDAGFETEFEDFDEPAVDSVLRRVQADMLLLSPSHSPLEETPDGSLIVANCAGMIRELEALKDYLLGLFYRDRNLRARDILVLVPDVARFAPAIRAVFGVGETSVSAGSGADEVSGIRIPFSVADRKPRDHALVEVFLRLVELAGTRKSASDVVAFIEQRVVAECFSLSPEDIVELRSIWASQGFRWGLDAAEREKLGFGKQGQNSWQAVMDSLVMGALMSGGGAENECVFAGVAPYENAEGDRLELIARACKAYRAICEGLRSMENGAPLSEWARVLPEAFNRIFAGSELIAKEHSGQRRAIFEAFTKLDELGQIAGDSPLESAEICSTLEMMLSERLVPYGFLSGGVTFAELKPMRSVPARVICLLGMDDESFPRQDRPLSFDLMARHPREGDRSMREADRYLFLETLLCARDRLYISYSGISPQGESDTPPAVPVSELLNYLAGPRNSGAFVIGHPLQPFSSAYFREGSAVSSYSLENYNAACELERVRTQGVHAAPLLDQPLPVSGLNSSLFAIDVDTLCRALLHPCKFFISEVLHMREVGGIELLEDEEPATFDGLSKYSARQRVTSALLDGRKAGDVLRKERALGTLPWGMSGEAAANGVLHEGDKIARVVAPLLEGERVSVPTRMDFTTEEGVSLTLEVNLGPLVKGRLVGYRSSRLRVNERLDAWVKAVVLSALVEDGLFEVEKPDELSVIEVGQDMMLELSLPLGGGKEVLYRLMSLYAAALQGPIPIFAGSSYAVACHKVTPRSKPPYEKAMDVWYGLPKQEDRYSPDPEKDDAWVRQAYRHIDPVAERHEFEMYAHLLWDGFNDCIKREEPL